MAFREGMTTPSECLLKAENYAFAATMAEGRKRRALLGAAAFWRNRAFQMQLQRFKRLRMPDGKEEPGGAGMAD